VHPKGASSMAMSGVSVPFFRSTEFEVSKITCMYVYHIIAM